MSMEKTSGIKMVGKSPEWLKEREKNKILNARFNHHLEAFPLKIQNILRGLELKKTNAEIDAIELINNEVKILARKSGVYSFNVPPNNHHLLTEKVFDEVLEKLGFNKKDGTEIADTLFDQQGIILKSEDVRKSQLVFTTTTFHENLHLNGCLAIEVSPTLNGKKETAFYRLGFSTLSTRRKSFHGKQHEHFAGLNEAIVSEAQKDFFHKIISLPTFSKEREDLYSVMDGVFRNKFLKNSGADEEDIVWADKKGNFIDIAYGSQRKVLEYVCSEIQKEFPQKYNNYKEVFEKEFLKAHFTGKLFPVSHAVEATFGEDSFRVLGNMGVDDKSGLLHLEQFQVLRRKQKKKVNSS